MLTEKEQEKLDDFFRDGAEDIEIEPEYWVHGEYEGQSFCYDCCMKKVAWFQAGDLENADEYCIDGGCGNSEGDSIPYCETCGKLLGNTLTDYGCEEEVNNFLECGFRIKSPEDCYAMERVIGSRGWEIWEERTYRNKDDKERDIKYYEKLEILCKRILNDIEKNG